MAKTKPSTSTKAAKSAPQKSAIIDNTIIILTIPAAEANQAYNQVLNRLKKNVTAPGFRKGAVPSKIAEDQIGSSEIIERALQQLVPDLYQAEISKNNYQPLTQPEFHPVKLEKGSDWVIEAHLAQKPEVNLKNYKNVVKKAKKEAAKHLEEQIKEAKKAHAKTVATVTKKDPEEGEKAAAAAKKITQPTAEQQKEHELHHIYQALVNENGPQVPELLVKEEVRYELNNLVSRLESMNMKLDDFLQRQGMTFEQLSAQFAAEALGRIQLTFLLDAIAAAEKLEVTDQEIEEQVNKIEDQKLREEQRKNPQYRALIEQTLKRRKVANWVAAL